MASLTGQQIQNSYQGLIKTENNGIAGGNDVKLTDGEGNGIGIELKPTGVLNSLVGFSNVDDTFKRGGIDIQNVNFDVTQSPMAPFNTFTGVAFTDQNDALTGSIVQNRYGGITLGNNIPQQPYIFTDFQSTARIDVNNFGNVNNSDNWLTGYNQSIPSASFDNGTRDLTINRNNDSDIVVNIPGGGGGGGSYSYRSDQYFTPGAYDGGIGPTYGFFTNTIIFYPIILGSGTLSEVALKVESLSATANDTRLVLYSAGNTTSTGHPSGTPSQLVADFGVVDTSVGGLITLSTSVTIEEGLYYYGIYQEGPWDASYRVFDRGTGQTGRYSQNRVSEDAINNTGSSFNAFYANVGAGFTPPSTFTASLSQSSDSSSMYFKLS
jgi:hypothetical protein